MFHPRHNPDVVQPQRPGDTDLNHQERHVPPDAGLRSEAERHKHPLLPCQNVRADALALASRRAAAEEPPAGVVGERPVKVLGAMMQRVHRHAHDRACREEVLINVQAAGQDFPGEEHRDGRAQPHAFIQAGSEVGHLLQEGSGHISLAGLRISSPLQVVNDIAALGRIRCHGQSSPQLLARELDLPLPARRSPAAEVRVQPETAQDGHLSQMFRIRTFNAIRSKKK